MFKNKKFIIYVIIFLILILIGITYLFLGRRREEKSISSQTTSPLPTLLPEGPSVPEKPNIELSKRQYFLRSVVSQKNPSFLYWGTSYPIYVSSLTAYNLNEEKTLHEFQAGSKFLYVPNPRYIASTLGNQIEAYDPISDKVNQLTYSTNGIYSPSLQKYAEFSSGKLTVYKNDGTALKNYPFSFQEGSIFWSPLERDILVQKEIDIYFINTDKKETSHFELKDIPEQIIFSPNGKYLSLLFKKYIDIFDSSNFNYLNRINFDSETKSISFIWTPKNNIFLIEKEYRPREVDLFYLIDPLSEKKVYLHDSFPIPTRINLKIEPASSANEDFLFADKAGGLWILSQQSPNPAENSLLNKSHDD